MQTEKRYRVGGELHGSKGDAERAARDAKQKVAAEARAAGIDEPDIALEVEPVELLTGAFQVVSERDGEVIVRDVDEATAEAEARRLGAEQAELRREAPIHALIPDDTATAPGEPAALVPHEPTPHPGYRVEPAPDRIIEPTVEEA